MNQFIRFPIQIITSGIIEFMYTSHFRVYACLDSHKNRKFQAFPSLETIQMKTKLNRHTIQRAIKDLIEWGMIRKAHVRREKGRGYKTVYTISQEPQIKQPLKKIKNKTNSSAKRKRDSKGKFTEQKQPHQRTVLNGYKQPHDMAIIQPKKPKKSKQPHCMATTNKPYRVDENVQKQPHDMANNQSSLSSIEPVKKEEEKKSPHTNSHKEKPKRKPRPGIDAGEQAFAKQASKILTGNEKEK